LGTNVDKLFEDVAYMLVAKTVAGNFSLLPSLSSSLPLPLPLFFSSFLPLFLSPSLLSSLPSLPPSKLRTNVAYMLVAKTIAGITPP
jgi:hypothetical protein